MDKITLYSPSGSAMEVDDTPRKRAWCKGKGYTLEAPPAAEKPAPEPEPEDSTED